MKRRLPLIEMPTTPGRPPTPPSMRDSKSVPATEIERKDFPPEYLLDRVEELAVRVYSLTNERDELEMKLAAVTGERDTLRGMLIAERETIEEHRAAVQPEGLVSVLTWKSAKVPPPDARLVILAYRIEGGISFEVAWYKEELKRWYTPYSERLQHPIAYTDPLYNPEFAAKLNAAFGTD